MNTALQILLEKYKKSKTHTPCDLVIKQFVTDIELLLKTDKEQHEGLKNEIDALKKVNKKYIHHLKVLLAASDGNLDSLRIEYGENYPEADCSIKAKEFLKTLTTFEK